MSAPSSLRVGVWNIERSGVDRRWRSEEQSKWLTGINAQVVVVTEVHASFTVSGRLPIALCAAGKHPYQPVEHSVGIWSTCPLLEVIPVSDARLGTCVRLQTNLGPAVVYGTILPYRDEGRSESKAPWKVHRETLKSQIKDWEGIRERWPDHHLLVAGDFNMTMEPSNAYVDRESRARLLEACNRLRLVCLTGDDTRPALGRSNVDHILVSESLVRVEQTSYWHPEATFRGTPQRLSDHNGCHVDLVPREV